MGSPRSFVLIFAVMALSSTYSPVLSLVAVGAHAWSKGMEIMSAATKATLCRFMRGIPYLLSQIGL
jgi:hypothetical protein